MTAGQRRGAFAFGFASYFLPEVDVLFVLVLVLRSAFCVLLATPGSGSPRAGPRGETKAKKSTPPPPPPARAPPPNPRLPAPPRPEFAWRLGRIR
jgi:hypothetical protein